METRTSSLASPSSSPPWPPTYSLVLLLLAATGGSHTLAAADEAAVQQQGCVHSGRVHRTGTEVPLENQPCLRCTCDRGRLLCHLRVCPPLPDSPRLRPGCRLQKAVGDCCARLACGDAANSTSFVQPVLTNQVARKDDDNELGLLPGAPILGRPAKKVDGKGCWVDGAHFGEGSALPSAVRCQRCYCLKNSVRCVRPTCHLNIQGCAPQYNHGSLSCCPSSYDCAALAASLATTLSTSTTTTTTTTTTTPAPPTTSIVENQGCLYQGRHFREGSRIPSGDVCRSCFCVRGSAKCTQAQCSTAAPGCAPILQPHHCCPVAYDCSNLESTSTAIPEQDLTEAGGSRVRDNDRVIDFAPEDVRQRYQTLRGKQPPRGGLFRPHNRKLPPKPATQQLSQDGPSHKPPRSTGSGVDVAAIRERGALWRRRLNATRLRPLTNSHRTSGKNSTPPITSSPVPTPSHPESTTEEEVSSTDSIHVSSTENYVSDLQYISDTTTMPVREFSSIPLSSQIITDATVGPADHSQATQSSALLDETVTSSTISMLLKETTQTSDTNDASAGEYAVTTFGHEVEVSAVAESDSENSMVPEQVGVVAQAEPQLEEHEHSSHSGSFSHEESSLDDMMGGHEEVIPNAEPDAILDGDVFDYFREISHISEHQLEAEEEEHADETTTAASTTTTRTTSNTPNDVITSSTTPIPTTRHLFPPSPTPFAQSPPLPPQPSNNLLTRRVGMRVQVGGEGYRSPPAPRGSTRFLSSGDSTSSEPTVPTSASISHQSTTETLPLTTMHQEVLGAPDAQPLPQAGVGSVDEVPGRSHSLLVIPFLPEDAVVEEGGTNTTQHANVETNLHGVSLPNTSTSLLSPTNLRSLEETVSPPNQTNIPNENLYQHLLQFANRNQMNADVAHPAHPAHIDFLGLPSPIAHPLTTPPDQWKPLAPGQLPHPVAGLEFDTPVASLVSPSLTHTSVSPGQGFSKPQEDELSVGSTVAQSETAIADNTPDTSNVAEMSDTHHESIPMVAEAVGQESPHLAEEDNTEEINESQTEVEEDEPEEPSPFLGLLSLFGFTGLGGAPADNKNEKPPLPPLPPPVHTPPVHNPPVHNPPVHIPPVHDPPPQVNAADSGWTPLQVQQGAFHPIQDGNTAPIPGQPPIGIGIARLPVANASGSFLVGRPKEEPTDSMSTHHWQGNVAGKPTIERISPPLKPINLTPPTFLETTTETVESSSAMHTATTESAFKKINATIATGSPESILHSLLHPLFRGDFSTLATTHAAMPITVSPNNEDVIPIENERRDDIASPTTNPSTIPTTTTTTRHPETTTNLHHDLDVVSSEEIGSVEHSFTEQDDFTSDVPTVPPTSPTTTTTTTTTQAPRPEAKEEIAHDNINTPVHGSALSNDAILSLLGLFNSHENRPISQSQPISHLPHNNPPYNSQQPVHHPVGSHPIAGLWPMPPGPPQHQPPPQHLPPPPHLYPQLANLHLPPPPPSTHQHFPPATSNFVLPQTTLVANNSAREPETSAPTTTSTLPPIPSTKENHDDNKLNPTTLTEKTETENTTPSPGSTHSTRTKPFAFNPFIFKVEGCDIYGKFYNLGDHVTDLSGSCKVCVCTEFGVQCKKQC